jgi:ABC-type antimicrobial peptide transport system permease subunit
MQIDQALARERLLAFLSTLMGFLAVTLAAIGLYGVLAFTVVRRTHEIGIRMAIGAERERILRLFLLESAWIVAAGVVVGIPLALVCGRLASSLLYGLAGQDVRTALGSTALLLAAAFTAAVIPAWRAARLDPLTALRHD